MATPSTLSFTIKEVELSLKERIQLAITRYEKALLANKKISQRKIADLYDVLRIIL